MRSIASAATLQIDVTNACVLQCSGCTHLCGHHRAPFFMSMDEFRRTVDSLKGYPSMLGIIGGEPLISPYISDMMTYLHGAFPPEQCGLWSVFPHGDKYVKLRGQICETFGNILLNDHSRSDIMHAPILVASGEYFSNLDDLYMAADQCWVANRWSPSVTNKGAFFCEVAAELDQLFEGPGGWEVKPNWWKKTPKDYTEQIERWCSKCGGCMPLARRSSQDEKCDISEGNFELLKGKSRKVDHGNVYVHKKGEFQFDYSLLDDGGYPNQRPYQELAYRQAIADRYGILLVQNERGYLTPVLKKDGWQSQSKRPTETLYQIINQKFPAQIDGAERVAPHG